MTSMGCSGIVDVSRMTTAMAAAASVQAFDDALVELVVHGFLVFSARHRLETDAEGWQARFAGLAR